MAADIRIRVDDVPIGSMKQGESGETKILFVRDADGIRAFAAECPHYGAPLIDGAICGRTLYCPWHKAAFDIGDGHLLEPPALDGLEQYAVRVDEGEAIVAMEAIEPDPPETIMSDEHVVVAGTGAAAVSAVITLRREGFGGTITMIGREASEPYDRTKLSKAFLTKKTPASAAVLDGDFADRYNVVAIRSGAARIEPDARRVTLVDGTVISGDALLIATGSRAVMPDIPGSDTGNVFTLRSLADAVRLTDAAETAEHVTIVGGGFIGLEAAAGLKTRGLAVDVVSPEALPLEQRFGREVARALKAFHEGNRIRFRQGEITRINGGEAGVTSIDLEDGETLATDLILIGAGAKPETDIIERAEKQPDGGVIVDDDLRLGTACWAAGDIAAVPDRRSRSRARIEHWRLAEQHGAYVAHAILGADAPFEPVPFFWSNQGSKRLDYAGYAPTWDRILVHGDVQALDFIAYYILDGQVLAACAIGQNERMIAFLHRLGQSARLKAEEIRVPSRHYGWSGCWSGRSTLCPPAISFSAMAQNSAARPSG